LPPLTPASVLGAAAALADKAEELLGTRRYLCGDALTECDVRLFPTLIRFDAVYVVYFKCSRKALREFPNLFNFTKDVYQQPGVAQTVDLQHIVRLRVPFPHQPLTEV
jgi:putative glutathione S-transferase